MFVPEPLARAISALSERLSHCPDPWLVGGSSGLLLQGVHIGSVPRDIDIYMDEPSTGAHALLQALALDGPEYSRTDKYSSTLSHYSLDGITVELVAGFQVDVPGASYRVRIRDQMEALAPRIDIGGLPVRLMPLAHELLFNLLRDRPDRFGAIADRMKLDLPLHLPALRMLICGNGFDRLWMERVGELLDLSKAELIGEADLHA